MPEPSFAAAYRAAQQRAGGGDPIEAGLLGRLADLECRRWTARVRPQPGVRLLARGAGIRARGGAGRANAVRRRGTRAAAQSGRADRCTTR